MFFTRVGKVLAGLGFAIGIMKFALGNWVAFGTPSMAENRAAARRYLGTSNSGEAINEAAIYILVAVALGILCEISSNLKARTLSEDQPKGENS